MTDMFPVAPSFIEFLRDPEIPCRSLLCCLLKQHSSISMIVLAETVPFLLLGSRRGYVISGEVARVMLWVLRLRDVELCHITDTGV